MSSSALPPDVVDRLRSTIDGPVFARGDDDIADELAAFDTSIIHRPDVAVGVATESDVAHALRFAAAHDLPVRVHATGHGAFTAADGGLIISTKRLDALTIDPQSRTARIGAGLRWRAVIDAAAEHGLAPIAGSSVTVGAVGYTLGGGIGPLARSHGYSSDWVRSFGVVTATGEVLTADADQHPDLFWALRGGKVGLGVVTEMSIELVPLATLYAGGLYFGGTQNIATALHAWVDWTSEAPEDVTTSVAMLNLPDIEAIPAALRGKRLLHLRFAYPGAREDGEPLVAPLRAAAPTVLDTVAEIPAAATGSIHGDPETGGATWMWSTSLTDLGHDLAQSLLDHVGPDTDAPFISTELRHLGGRTAIDVSEGSAVGGRENAFTLSMLAADPASFDDHAPRTAAAVAATIGASRAPLTNINFGGDPALPKTVDAAWRPAVADRLASVRAAYDPEGVLAVAAV